uniref:RING-H2 finger protein ATL2 n=1 Tax=Solanum tuberosum TaxID=4113 RepID=M1D4S8_SOLTU
MVELGLCKSGSCNETETTYRYTHSENNDYIWAKPDPFLHFQIPPSTQGIRLEDCKIPHRKRKQGVILAAKGQALEKKKKLQLVKPESGGGSDGGGRGGGGHGGGGIG